MNSCTEFVLDDLMAIIAIPVGNIAPSSADSPALEKAKTVAGNFSGHYYPDTIVIGRSPVKQTVQKGGASETFTSGLIPIIQATGKAVDDESDSVAGRMHTVKVTCKVDDRDSAVWDRLLELERTPRHLLLTFHDGVTQGFVTATQDTYLCEVGREGAKTSVTFRIQNLMGVRLVTGA